MVISSSGPSKNYQEQPLFYPVIRDDIKARIDVLFSSPQFRDVVAERLAGAVRIRSITYDEMGKVGSDSRWDIFYDFSKYLRDTFAVL